KVINFSLDQKKLLPSAANLFFLLYQKIVDRIRVSVLNKSGNLLPRHIHNAQVAYCIQAFKLPGAKIVVACIPIYIFRFHKVDSVVVAQDTDADVKQSGYLDDLE